MSKASQVSDLPIAVSRMDYEDAVQKVTSLMAGVPGVRSIYQIGSVSTPGISDIDMVIVFDNDASCTLDPRDGLGGVSDYLFIHRLYGTSVGHFEEAQSLTLFHNYNLLWGEDLPTISANGSVDLPADLKIQTALEYLLKMYVNMVVQRELGVVRIRSFFLHARAIIYDLEYLGISEGGLYEITKSVFDIRQGWFSGNQDPTLVVEVFEAFYRCLVPFLEDTFATHRLYTAEPGPLQLARSISLRDGPSVGYERRGIRLPSQLGILGRKYFALNNRLNRFEFTAPLTTTTESSDLTARHDLTERMRAYNSKHLPNFGSMSSSLAGI